jgi:hypothetical protein
VIRRPGPAPQKVGPLVSGNNNTNNNSSSNSKKVTTEQQHSLAAGFRERDGSGGIGGSDGAESRVTRWRAQTPPPNFP